MSVTATECAYKQVHKIRFIFVSGLFSKFTQDPAVVFRRTCSHLTPPPPLSAENCEIKKKIDSRLTYNLTRGRPKKAC